MPINLKHPGKYVLLPFITKSTTFQENLTFVKLTQAEYFVWELGKEALPVLRHINKEINELVLNGCIQS